jgi:glycosyltransferase involved in cell wall biosynthesis
MVTVIISTYNNEKTISHAISSILKQNHRNLELIVINDCSNDKTEEVIKSFNDSRIVYLKNKKNMGMSWSLNRAIDFAKGEFIAIMDGDDISCPNRLSKQVNFLIKNSDIDLVASNVIYFHKNKVLGYSNLKLHKSNIFNLYCRASELPHPTWMARASFFKKFKYNPDMKSCGDSDLIFRARLSSKFFLLKESLIYYQVPYKQNLFYKLSQCKLIFLSRLQIIRKYNKLFLYPLIFSALIFSYVLYILRFRSVKFQTSDNLKYQDLFDKLTKNSQLTIVNVISSNKGGGAEIIVNELDKIYIDKKINSYVIYFNGEKDSIKKNHFFFDISSRNPIGIFYLRRVLKKLLYSTNKDIIIHAHLTWPFFFTVFALLGLKNYKLFFTEHDIINKRRKIPFFNFIDKIFYTNYKNIVCISNGVYKNLLDWIGFTIKKRLKVIYNGARIFPSSNRTELIKRLPRLISVGRLINKKNFLTTINAISSMRNDIQNYTIVGQGKMEQDILNLIKTKKLSKKIKLVGWSDQVEKYYRNSDIQLIPSLYEGFGLVAAEGMSTGLVIVASNIKGLKEVVGYKNPSVILVNDLESIEEWKNKIYKAIHKINKFGFQKISKFSELQAKKFTFNKMAEKYLSLYLKN